ncbi:MAG: hypothetical protein ABIN89_28075 [Chitinophagaceae bacterium]
MKRLFTVTIILAGILQSYSSHAQSNRLDDLFAGRDTTAIMDSLMKEFDAYLDSLIKPKGFFTISAGVGTGFFSFKDNVNLDFQVKNKAVFSPEISYFHKSGLGISLSGYMIKEGAKLNPYQYAISPTYHYVKRNQFSTGISYTRFYSKENLSFYTTPIQHEVYTFFNIKKWWLEPGIAFSYGWGSKTEFEHKEVDVYLKRLKASKKKIIVIQRDESVRDFSTLFSVRHSFIYDKVFLKNDVLTFRPVLLLSAGTQNFGFNTSFSSNSVLTRNILPSNSYISDVRGLDFQSSTFVLQVDYSLGRYYVLPQLLLDYYLHKADKRFNSVVSFTAGVNF